MKNLGITAVWLNPIYLSPGVDNGYDVSDYYQIDPVMGTMADFENLVQDLHQAGIKLIMDFVLNHTSDQHPWFKAAISDPKSPYRDYYIFAGKMGKNPTTGAASLAAASGPRIQPGPASLTSTSLPRKCRT